MAKPPAAPKPTAGRIVHYVLPGGPTAGDHRPAIVVDTGRPTGTGDWEAHLHVFFRPHDEPNLPSVAKFDNGLELHRRKYELSTYVQSVEPDNGGTGNPRLGTWHWPERENADEPKPQTR